jgi:hypothetical protein
MPKQVLDLRVEEIGDKILVHFTPPKLTTEELPITGLRAITLYVGPRETPFIREKWSATARRYQLQVTDTDFEILAGEWANTDLALFIRTTGRTGRESDWSNPATLLVGTPLRTPANIDVANDPDAVRIKWTGNAQRYRVLRSVEGKLEPIGETDVAEYVDRSIVYGMRYEYVIVGLAGQNQQSLPSMPSPIVPADVFSPAVPAGLTAVASGRSIDLSWTRSSDDDLAGYNIFRATADGPFELLVQRIPLPAYSDTGVESGKRYRYRVSAVDTANNESAPSMEGTAQVE